MSVDAFRNSDMRTALGIRAKGCRERMGWTQRQVALRLHVSHVNIGYVESGTSGPSLELLVSMSRLYGVSIDWLLGLID